ncbi:beta-lactamase/transpeptidase-like protein [Lindgomyces ingoldianus]|uniref:Beta-lactamase/transpeptidase-like protein n=1 Tax=Lindgomyces ingoldianus TaxID=673940 RepID=A0ACB6RE56_9PLEO|nr:beta-lactamase/transpeptidase-like protein [Lindgomyces ingoldianus]KAF2476617.1 beta-lactamase/transpeptidase-like protein [Lindgomyces ingoldianus]
MPPLQDANAPSTQDPNPDASNPSGPPPIAVPAPRQPPPETQESVWMRRAVISSFWAVVLFLGLPVWWKTTAIYRADLPLQTMTDWADGKICKPVFPLRIAVEAPALLSVDAQHLIRTTQHALDDLNEFSAHHLRLMLADSPWTANISQQVVSDGMRISAKDEDIALSIRLVPVETGTTPRSHLQQYSPTLDVYYTANQLPPPSSTSSPLATFIANELHKMFAEEQALLAYLLSTTSGAHTAKIKSLSPDTTADLERQSTRALKYAPTYHLTFSLFSPTSVPSAWEIESALRQYLSPLLESFAAINNFTVDTQVQLYAGFSPSIRQPEYDDTLKAWTLRKEDLSGFINAAEWPLSPSIGIGPTVNFVLYVPDPSQSPLLVKENGGNSWLIPQWGGVLILNPALSTNSPTILTTLTTDALAPAMHTFSNQLLSLLGLPQTPHSLPLRLSTLKRVRAASLLFSASSTLGALARLTRALPSIPIPDKVAISVHLTTDHLQQACNNLREGRFQGALEHARIAEAEAEKAFFERSMVGQVYFPDEHKVAVYLPLLGPVAVPLVMAALKEVKTRNKRPRDILRCATDAVYSISSCSPVLLYYDGANRFRVALLGCPIHTSKLAVLPNTARLRNCKWALVPQESQAHLFAMSLSAESVQTVKSILDGVTAESKTGVPGLVFIAVDRNGKTLVEHASGTRSLNSKEPMDMETMFWIASMTKIVATIACMQLYEEGKMPLDDSEFVKKYAPEISKKKVYADGVTPMEQEKGVTMRMLLSHTAGFGYSFWDPRVNMQGRPIGIEEFHGDVEDILESPMVNQPGSMWEYGINIDWAGIILERVTGLKLGAYMEKHIFEPLGITGMTMFPTKEEQKNMAASHQRDAEGNVSERNHLYRRVLRAQTKEEQDRIFNSAGAGLFARPNEYVKILATLCNNGTSPTTGRTILKKETVDLMWENQIPNQPDFARNGPPPADPTLANYAPEMYPQEGNPPQGWGLSMFLTIAPGMTGRAANTGWWAGIANLFWWVDREKGVAGIVAGQVLPFGDGKIISAWFGVEKAVYEGLRK